MRWAAALLLLLLHPSRLPEGRDRRGRHHVPRRRALVLGRDDDDGFTIPASVPGDVGRTWSGPGVIEDPLRDDNFVRDAPTWNRTWTLRTTFRVDSDAARIAAGLRWRQAGRTVTLNHATLGTVRDQFLRYAFDVRNASIDLLRETNKLELIFIHRSTSVAGSRRVPAGGIGRPT